MRLKLDLHPIYSDSRKIEEALEGIIEEAVTKRAAEVEIIPGKGSGALKKSVLRFLDRPEIKARYHRLEKDGDNWGRLFVHFRHERADQGGSVKATITPIRTLETPCACCTDAITIPEPEEEGPVNVDCPWCGSPNRLLLRRDCRGLLHARAELDYGEA